MKLIIFLSYILYCFYIGILLVFLPWSPLWDANQLVVQYPALRNIVLAGPMRGVVSGLGILLLFMGSIDAWHFIRYGRGAGRAEEEPGGTS